MNTTEQFQIYLNRAKQGCSEFTESEVNEFSQMLLDNYDLNKIIDYGNVYYQLHKHMAQKQMN